MRSFIRTLTVTAIALIAAVVLALGSTLTTTVALTATTALIMGGTGRPNPDDFPGYVPNVAQYYIYPNTVCAPPGCDLEAVYTPETAWPLYGGPDAPTWKQSILQGTALFGEAVDTQLETLGPDDSLVLFGYSQSGAILAYQKQALADLSDEEKAQIEFVVIGNVSRPNGGLNTRLLGFSAPIVEFPFGPSMPTDTGIETTDIAMKWDIIADAPLYLTNPLAMINAILGFEYVHGTYPQPTEADPDETPGGYTAEQWQWMMDNPELYPELVDVQQHGDTTYITVTPTVLPLVAPLHDIGLKPLADLLEPALRVLIEQTGYDRSLPYGQTTGFRLIPIFNPVTLAVDLIKAVPQGVDQMLRGLRGEPTWIVPQPPETLTDSTDDAADSAAAQRVSTAAVSEPEKTEAAVSEKPVSDEPVSEDAEPVATDDTEPTKDEPKAKPAKNVFTEMERGLRDFGDRIQAALNPRKATKEDDKTSDDNSKADDDKGSDDKGSDDKKADEKKTDAPKSDDKSTEKVSAAA
ncbi:hypothetical protein BCA37_24235 [Mycobacterium sp. djl-10]|nr:hypothetical protein BCA37_24235 [Mycobacterium sp. djl-10]